MHFVHALHDDAVLPMRPPNPVPHQRISRSSLTSSQIFHVSERTESKVAPTLPLVSADAVVTGKVRWGYNTVGTASWAGAARGLLHGRRRPSKYTRCPVCTEVHCNKGTGFCTGHCKKKATLFTCRPIGRSANSCFDDSKRDPSTLEPDTLDSLDSVVVSTAAPYIGCANITGAPSGCPAEGTRGFNDERMLEYTVLSSSCEQHLYTPPCNDTLFYPFGYCSCVIGFEGGGPAHVPCYLPHLDYTAPPLQDTAGVPVWVIPEGNMTVTTYGIREEVDRRALMFDTVFDLGFASISVEMAVWTAHVGPGEDIVLEGPFPDHK